MGDRENSQEGAGAQLVLSATRVDIGNRPISPPWWHSPAIRRKEGAITKPLTDVVTAGVPIRLVAQVFNMGSSDALNVHAEFWWARSAPVLLKDPNHAHRIGGRKPELKSVPSGGVEEFMCDEVWTPPFLSGGAHPCLIVQAEGSNCPLSDEFRADPMFRVDRYCQIARHNVTVISEPQQIQLIIFNPFPDAGSTAIYVISMRISGERVRELANAVLLEAARPEMRRWLREEGVIVSELDSPAFLRLVEVGEVQTMPSEASSSVHFGHPNDRLTGRPLCELRLPRGGSAAIVVESGERPHQPDEVLVHHIIQVSDGFEVGGYSLVER